MKNIATYLLLLLVWVFFCKVTDLKPESHLPVSGFWKTATHDEIGLPGLYSYFYAGEQ